MKTAIEVTLALLPFAMLIAGFLLFRLDALTTSIYAWAIEMIVFLFYYHFGLTKSIEASIWGNITMWTGFLVLYTGQIFGQAYRSTGLLQTLLTSVESILPARDKEGRAVALVTVVGGFIGAFNGFATYPVTIPGLVELGFGGTQAAAAYLVYFSWSVPFVSLFIAANISNVATHLPIPEIAQVSGILAIPLVFVSLFGFLRILGFRFLERETQILFWLLGASNIAGIVLFTQIWPAYYILTLISGSAISLVALYVYGRKAQQPVLGSVSAPTPAVPAAKIAAPEAQAGSVDHVVRAYAPLLLGVIVVAATSIGSVKKLLDHLSFNVSAWGYSQISINIVTSAGFFIFLTALCCYFFSIKPANAAKDLVIASKRSASSLATLFVGSAMVYLMVDSGQIALLGNALSGAGKLVYSATFPVLAFLGGMAFGQGLPGDFMFAHMQIPVAPLLGVPLVVLVGIVTVVTMGPANPLKPALIRYVASLANVKGQDSAIFRTALPWQLLQVAVTAVMSVILLAVWH